MSTANYPLHDKGTNKLLAAIAAHEGCLPPKVLPKAFVPVRADELAALVDLHEIGNDSRIEAYLNEILEDRFWAGHAAGIEASSTPVTPLPGSEKKIKRKPFVVKEEGRSRYCITTDPKGAVGSYWWSTAGRWVKETGGGVVTVGNLSPADVAPDRIAALPEPPADAVWGSVTDGPTNEATTDALEAARAAAMLTQVPNCHKTTFSHPVQSPGFDGGDSLMDGGAQ